MTSVPPTNPRARMLFVSNLYPNPKEPARGTFNRQTVHALAEQLDVRVLAAVPWFPGRGSMDGIPEQVDESGVPVRYVRAFYTPIILRNLHGEFFRNSIRPAALDIRREFPFDILYGSWVYPDGYGVVLLARELGIPCVLHALGSDIHYYLKHPRRRKKVVAALTGADHVISVSRYIRDSIVSAGVPAERCSVIYDGVDTTLFHPRERSEVRKRLGLPAQDRIILFVGSLRGVKAPQNLVEAFAKLKNDPGRKLHLAMVGTGPLREKLEERVAELGLVKQVTFAGGMAHSQVPEWMGAADLLCLSSLDEGMPNVVLEALASGLPVVASNVGGVSEVLDSDQLGLLVPPGNVNALASALEEALSRNWQTNALLDRALAFSWHEHGAQISSVVANVLAKRRS